MSREGWICPRHGGVAPHLVVCPACVPSTPYEHPCSVPTPDVSYVPIVWPFAPAVPNIGDVTCVGFGVIGTTGGVRS